MKGVTPKYYLTKEKMENILTDIEITEPTKYFLAQCYQTMYVNHCDNGKNAVQDTEYINFQSINTVMCIQFGQDYIDIMKIPGEE